MTFKTKIMSFATVLCLIPENVYGRLQKKNNSGWEMDWQLVASYFTVKSMDILQCINDTLISSNCWQTLFVTARKDNG